MTDPGADGSVESRAVEVSGDASRPTSSAVRRLYWVYRGYNKLPLLGAWRDKEAALSYADSVDADLVVGIDVSYVAVPPFIVSPEE